MNKTNWSLFVPIHNLEISRDIGGELRVENVVFISSDKIPFIRKRLGLPEKVSYYRSRITPIGDKGLFSGAKVYAFLKSRRCPEDNLTHEFRRIKEAVCVLASSQMYRLSRHERILFGGPEYGNILLDDYFLFSNSNKDWKYCPMRLDSIKPYRLDKQWKRQLSSHFFPRLLRILNGEISVSPKWRFSLRNAALLGGLSCLSRNIWESFMYDMVAIELLLTKRGEPFPDTVLDRMMTFFGWLTDWSPRPWKDLIKRLYKLRNKFVHAGRITDITGLDIINADMLLANLLNTLCSLTKLIKSKEDIIELTNKLAACKVLGIKFKGGPKQLTFHKQTWLKQDIEKLERRRHWLW
ncbi:MAG: hypothetical protein P9M00_01155 [Candidatus Tritonobacter lacicola]|nr:hypothetical protein [Candidatus Tritonobacter lacicola]